MQVQLCLQRGFQRLRGDMSIVLGGAIGNTILAMIISSIFYNLPSNTGSFSSRAVLLFFAILLNAFSSFLEVRSGLSLLITRVLTIQLDPNALCATAYCREAYEVRILSPIFRSNSLHDLRLAKQNHYLAILQYHSLLHDKSSQNAGVILYLLSFLLRPHLNHVYAFPKYRSRLANACRSHGPGIGSNFSSNHLHWIHSSNT